jgi:ribonuclease P protein component
LTETTSLEDRVASFDFGKDYKLCSKIVIDDLFVTGETVKQYPLRLIYKPNPLHSSLRTSFQIVISVPKKKIRKAHDRNKVKRILRELIRKNKNELELLLTDKQLKLALFLIYSESALLDYTILEKKIKKLFQQLQNTITNEKP